ncbi:hypothetical protein ACWEPN_22905 [Nonomuraea wenchangensis]
MQEPDHRAGLVHHVYLGCRYGCRRSVLFDEEVDQQAAHDEVAARGVQAGEVSALDDREDEVGDAVEQTGAQGVPPQKKAGHAEHMRGRGGGGVVQQCPTCRCPPRRPGAKPLGGSKDAVAPHLAGLSFPTTPDDRWKTSAFTLAARLSNTCLTDQWLETEHCRFVMSTEL